MELTTESWMSIMRRGRSLTVDLIIVGLASIAALGLRENFSITEDRWGAFAPHLLLTLAFAGPTLVFFELDRSVWRFSGLADYVRAVIASVLIVAGATVLSFVLNRLDGVARSLPALQVLLIAAGLVGIRVLTRVMHARRRVSDHEPVALPTADDTVLIVGWSALVDLFVRSAAEFGSDKLHIAGILSPRPSHVGRLVHAVRVLGTPEEVDKVIANLDVHGIHVGRIVVATTMDRLSDEARRVLREIESTTDIRVEFIAERLGMSSSNARPAVRSAPSDMQGARAFAIQETAFEQVLRRPYWRMKRVFDATVALALIALLAPVILLTALVVAFDVGLPVLFMQQRPGRRGSRFTLYKFRTMGPSHDAAGVRIPDDARISRFGKFMRRTRLDELPQLFNILVGDMSFVGPRPLVTREQSPTIVARLLVRPGLTGWAQVYGGRTVSMADKVALDLWYVRHASFLLDFKIMAATLPLVIFGERVDGEIVRLAWRDLHGLQGRAVRE